MSFRLGLPSTGVALDGGPSLAVKVAFKDPQLNSFQVVRYRDQETKKVEIVDLIKIV